MKENFKKKPMVESRTDKRETDGARMSENIILVSNDTLSKNEWYSRIVLKIYGDKETLVDQKDSLNMVFPGYYQVADLGNRFTRTKILTPDFVGAFQ